MADFRDVIIRGTLTLIEDGGIDEIGIIVNEETLVQAATVDVDFAVTRAKTIDLDGTAVIFDLKNFPLSSAGKIGYCTLEIAFTSTLPTITWLSEGVAIQDTTPGSPETYAISGVPDLSAATPTTGSALIQISKGRLGYRFKVVEVV